MYINCVGQVKEKKLFFFSYINNNNGTIIKQVQLTNCDYIEENKNIIGTLFLQTSNVFLSLFRLLCLHRLICQV